MAKTLIGREAIRTQTLALEAFGRFYGQGIHETPVALQTAIANAALDTFVQKVVRITLSQHMRMSPVPAA